MDISESLPPKLLDESLKWMEFYKDIDQILEEHIG